MTIVRRQGRGRTAALAFAIALIASACVPADVRKALPGLSTVEPTYAAHWRPWFPWWYTLYSIVPGNGETDCVPPPPAVTNRPHLRIELLPCIALPEQERSVLAADMGKAAGVVETAFSGRIRISRIELRLVRPHARVMEHRSILLDRDRLQLLFAAPYDNGAPERSRRAIVRSAAHELFHMAMRTLSPWHDGERSNPPEEVAAALFESCVEDAVFDSVSPSAFDIARQADPRGLAGSAGAYRSAASNLQATRQLGDIAGPDDMISTAGERMRLRALCASLAP